MTYLASNGLLAVEKSLTTRLAMLQESAPDKGPPGNIAPNPRKGVAPGKYSPGYGARRAAGTHREWGGRKPPTVKPSAAAPAASRFNAPIDFPSRRQTRAGRKAYRAAAPGTPAPAAAAARRFNAPMDFPSRRQVRQGRKAYNAAAPKAAPKEAAAKLPGRFNVPMDFPSRKQVRRGRKAYLAGAQSSAKEAAEKVPKLQRRTFAGTTPIDLPSGRQVRAQRRALNAAQAGPKPTRQPKAPKPTYPKISRQARRTWATTSTGAPIPKGPSALQRLSARREARRSAKAGPTPAPSPAPQSAAPRPGAAPPAKPSGGFGSLTRGRKALLGGGALLAAAGTGHILGTRRVEKAMPENVPALRRERRALGRKTKAGLIAGGVLIPAAVAGGEMYRRRRQDVGKSELAYLGEVSKSAMSIDKGLPSYLRGVARAGQFPQGVKNTSAMGNRIAAHKKGRLAAKHMSGVGSAKTSAEFNRSANAFADVAAQGRAHRSFSR